MLGVRSLALVMMISSVILARWPLAVILILVPSMVLLTNLTILWETEMKKKRKMMKKEVEFERKWEEGPGVSQGLLVRSYLLCQMVLKQPMTWLLIPQKEMEKEKGEIDQAKKALMRSEVMERKRGKSVVVISQRLVQVFVLVLVLVLELVWELGLFRSKGKKKQKRGGWETPFGLAPGEGRWNSLMMLKDEELVLAMMLKDEELVLELIQEQEPVFQGKFWEVFLGRLSLMSLCRKVLDLKPLMVRQLMMKDEVQSMEDLVVISVRLMGVALSMVALLMKKKLIVKIVMKRDEVIL